MPRPASSSKPKWFHLVAIMLTAGFVLAGKAVFAPSSLELKSRYGPSDGLAPIENVASLDWLRDEILWLGSCQLPNGAILMTPCSDSVIPYFANLAASVMVDYDAAWAKQYILWYLSNINQPDRWGAKGTIYDFRVRNGKMVATKDYDSADSYASTFLSLVSHYHGITRDDEFVLSQKKSLDLIASVLTDLTDVDGLVRVKPNTRTKYLMDNAENYRGLTDWSETLHSLGFSQEAERFKALANKINGAIEDKLFNPKSGDYAWSVWWLGKRYPRARRWYPDAVSQVFMISTGLLDPEGPRANAVWRVFNSRFPNWEWGDTGDEFPWVEVAVAALQMGEPDKARDFLIWLQEQKAHDRGQWNVMESASLIKVHQMLGGFSLEMVKAGPQENPA